MAIDRLSWKPLAGALAITYFFWLGFKTINQHLDKSPPEPLQSVVVQQFTRYNPIPIRVTEVKGSDGILYDVDVRNSTANQLSKGSPLTIVRKRGFFGRPWAQDKDFYESLEKSRPLQATVAIALFFLLIVSWLGQSVKLKAIVPGAAALCVSLLASFAVFRFLP